MAGAAEWPAAFVQIPFRKAAAYGALAVTFAVFGDSLLEIGGHGLLLFLEVLESFLDHSLEALFHLDPWRAQLVTAWTGFFIFLGIMAMAVRWLRGKYLYFKARLGGKPA